MRKRLIVLLAFGMLGAGMLTAAGSAAAGTTKAGACASRLPAKIGRFSGIVSAQAISGPLCDPTSPLGASPPLVWHGVPVMLGPSTITPIYWESPCYTNPGDYRNLINQYRADVAAASGTNSNVF